MKKLSMKILALLVCFVMAFPLFACSKKNNPTKTTSTTTTTSTSSVSSNQTSVKNTTSNTTKPNTTNTSNTSVSTKPSTSSSSQATTAPSSSSVTTSASTSVKPSTTSVGTTSTSSSSLSTTTTSNSTSVSSSSLTNSSSSSSIVIPPNDYKDPVAVKVNSVTLGDVRVQLLSKSLVRIENRGPKGFEDRASYLVTNRNYWDVVDYQTVQGANETVIKTTHYSVHIPTGGTAESCYITTPGNDKKLYNYVGATDTNVYLPSPSDELKSWYFTDSPRVIPSETGWNNVNELNQGWDFDNNATDIFVFLPNGDYSTFTSDYVKLTGESEMVDLQTLGFWDSRWYAYSAETALKQIQDYRDHGFSIDVLVIDTDWRDASNGVGYEINKTLFPNMQEFLTKCEELGVDIAFNDHPEPVAGTTNGLDGSEIDYRSNNLTMILGLGLDYWWYDRNWHVSLNSFHPDVSVYAFGMYAYQFVTKEYLDSITDLGEFAERGLIMANVDGCLHGKWDYASDLTAHRYSIQWTGDIGADTNALAQEIYATIFGGAEVGLPYISSDIGGHTEKVTNEMYARWIQYGALSTLCRVHCTNSKNIGQEGRMPWLFGETAEKISLQYLNMRYRLMPLYYYLSYRNYSTGLPIMARTDINYSNYIEAQANDQYLLGDYLLVAPLDSAGPSVKIPDNYLSHTEGSNKLPGLKAEYYSTNNFTGSPKVTTDNNVFFNWATGGPTGLPTDNFSVIWSGEFKVADYNATLSFYSDDGIIVTIDGQVVINGPDTYDTLFTTPVYKANTTHSIEIKYIELGGNAHVYMYYQEQKGDSTSYDSREVFIPDGTWIDVWSGERFVGPCTYKVTHPLETSPIFVREGSLILLADNATNTRQQLWNKLSLDVYPSKNYNAKAVLYEDDTYTVAYKSGQYRTTDVEMAFDNAKNALVITINPTCGQFSGPKAFTERDWNLRIHTNPNWGDITNVLVNNVSKTATKLNKDTNALPFAFTGAACDGDLYTLTLNGLSVYTKITIEIYYDSVVDSSTNTSYDNTAINFTMKAEDSGDIIDLDKAGDIAWVSYGDITATDVYSKTGAVNPFSYPTSYESPWANYNNNFNKQYIKNGKTIVSNGGISTHKDLSFTIDTIGTEAYYVLYIGGNQSTAKITVADRAGNKYTEFIGNIKGKYLSRIVIHVTDTKASTLYVTFAMQASEYKKVTGYSTSSTSPSNVTLFACLVSQTLPTINNYVSGNLTAGVQSITDATGSANLTTYGETFGEETLDWIHTGNDGGVNRVRRYGGNNISSINFTTEGQFGDYAMSLSYFDGEQLGAHTGSTKGTCSQGTITVTVIVTPNVKHVTLFTGAWISTNTVSLYDRSGKLLYMGDSFTAGEASVCKVVKISVSATETDILTIKIVPTAMGEFGNVSLPAVVVSGTASTKTTSASIADCKEISGEINLTEAGPTDWLYLANGSKKANSSYLSSASNIAMGGVYDFTGFGATFSYTDGTDGSKTSLNSGKNLDYARFTVNLQKGYNYLDIYANITNCVAGVHLLDSNDAIIGSYTPFTNSTTTAKSILIRLLFNTEKEETITIFFYKGGSGSGACGLVALALASNVAPATGVTSTASVADIASKSIYLNKADASLDTLYWEHYSSTATEKMLNATDIVTNSIETASTSPFEDYKATLNWTNGTKNTAWITNKNGLCAGNTEYEITVKVDKNVKAIKVYTGSWKATGTATLYHNGMLKATSESWTAGTDSVARCVTFTINTAYEETVTIKITPSAVAEYGNVSMVAVAVLGVKDNTQTTAISLTTSQMTDYNNNKYNLTSYGTQDWYYLNYDNVADEKSGGSSIITSSLAIDGKAAFWDYPAAFNWTDGTTNPTSPIDNDCNNAGTNNGYCGSYVKINVNVTSSTTNVYLWVGGFQSEYYVQAIDSKGNIIVNQFMHGAESGKSFAYLCDFAVTPSASETLTFVVYRTSGTNCSLAAVAVKN